MDTDTRLVDALRHASRTWAERARASSSWWRDQVRPDPRPGPTRRPTATGSRWRSDRRADAGRAGGVLDAYVAYTRGLIDLGADYMASAVRLNQEYQERLWDVATTNRGARPSHRTAPGAPSSLTMRCPLGVSTPGRFVVENTRTTTLRLGLATTRLLTDDGREVAGSIGVHPSDVEVAPGEEVAIDVTVTIDGPDWLDESTPCRSHIVAEAMPEFDLQIVALPVRSAS